MSRQDRNIEDLFRTLLEQFSVNPTPGLWKKIQAKIMWKQFLSFSLNSFNLCYLGGIIALAVTGVYYMFPRTDNHEIAEKSEIILSGQVFRPGPAHDQVIPREEPIAAVMKAPRPVGSTALKKQLAEPSAQTVTRQKKSADQPIPQEKTAGLEQVSESEVIPPAEALSGETGSGSVTEAFQVRIDFKAVPMSGCLPLAVNFQNLSENCTGISWNFGDGGNSVEFNPSYVFDEPGEFLVTLNVQGKDGGEYSRQQNVRVFETPEALFEFDEDVKPSKNQPIYFYNYSRGADHYEWDFGDNQLSHLQDPIHFYQGNGNYHVKLKVWTDHQCYDSMEVFNAFTTQEQHIRVPNAFTPNLDGPTGGYYDMNDYSNNVFHPVTNGELVEFQLKVFDRKGLLLFESKDINLGWDGYYNEQLMKQDVYIWKIRGKFNNGKTFVESGDVTLIKQN